ncbi:MAG: bifunctional folylpolyglutamate synthase/dihydrofolate synthase [Gammaproteobacteria bacterium]|nr:MAG: bifunctional folylpolyglutamate synthase/dihydrofolate synthase [Pseudomonadota bacterium]PIE38029.1 MAG: bifunctional folylpolyglutamate synthase/dihydrofolate synthase [Gammaproteobacteria bacterium]
MSSQPVPCKNLHEWLSFLEGLHTSEIDLGLDRVLTVFRDMNIGKIAGCVILVAGTNGKGTTIAAMEALLQSAGKSTGCYLSPHIHFFNERVRIDGRNMSDETWVEAFERVESHRGQVSLTYFEFTTLAALFIIARQMPDFALLEVGLGGRLDAVNIVEPDVSVITSVGLDHQDWLGEDRESIGFEKAGIMRPGGVCVYGEVNPTKSILQQASAQNVDLRVFGRDFGVLDADSEPATETMTDSPVFLAQNSAQQPIPDAPVPVSYQMADGDFVRTVLSEQSIPVSNRLCAIQALALTGVRLDKIDIDHCLSLISVPGRFEVDKNNPKYIYDVAHNVHAAEYLSRLLQATRQRRRGKIVCLFSALKDKDSKGIVSLLDKTVDSWAGWPMQVDRALSLAQLTAVLGDNATNAECLPTLGEAVVRAENIACDRNDTIMVLGSFYAVAEVQSFLTNRANRSRGVDEKGIEV